MRTLAPAIVSFYLLPAAAASETTTWSACNRSSVDRATVESVRAIRAGTLEAGLADAAFSAWLVQALGAGWSTCWEVNDCGEQTGNPALDRRGRFPTCVEARATTESGALLAATVITGERTAEGEASSPRVFGTYARVGAELRRLGSLAEMAAIARTLATPPRNDSPIRFETFDGAFGRFQFCWRSEWERVPLRGSALYEWDLVRGTPCVVADFDGNGYLDFALQGYGLPRIRPERKVRVVFYQGSQAVRTLDIPGAGFELYPPRREEGEFGEPASNLPGLVKWGEGGSTFIWLFDSTTETLRRSEHASEHH